MKSSMWDLKLNEESRTTPRIFADSHGSNWASPKLISPKFATETFLRFPLITIVTSPLHESRLHWIHDPNPNQSHRVTPRQTVPRTNNNTVPRNNHNTVPRNNNVVQNSDSRTRNPLEPIPSTSRYNSNLPIPSASSPRKTVSKHSQSVPRSNNHENSKTTQVVNNAKCSSPPLRKRGIENTEEKDVRERENKIASFIRDARLASQSTAVPGSPVVPARVTQSTPQAVDPISPMRTAVYPPPGFVSNTPTNDNSPFQIGLESSRNLGLYKPAVPDQNQDTWAYNFAANSSGIGPPSPTRTFEASSSGSGTRAGIVYPHPCGRRPDVCIQVEASLPEPAALLRPDLPKIESPTQPQEAPASRQRASSRLSCKRRRNRSTAVFRPAKRSPPRGHWYD